MLPGMGSSAAAPASLFSDPPGTGIDAARLGWLIRLRWVALGGILVAAGISAAGAFPGVAWPVLLATVVIGVLYNGWLLARYRRGTLRGGRRAAMTQALVDLLILTVVLWASGGLDSPFVAYYVFHVALTGILAGPRATVIAFIAALGGTLLLELTRVVPVLRIGVWNPVPPWEGIAQVAAFTTTVGAVAYLVTHAVRELHDREQALARARDRAALEYELLSNTLDELEAGLEVVDTEGHVLFRNKRAEELSSPPHVADAWRCPGEERACERDVTGVCPVHEALHRGEAGRCRFAAPVDGIERVYEMMAFPLSHERGGESRVMNLYVDRTQATLAERRLMLSERLASLGRVAQGVAHELNTPLATVRTLAVDMRAALRDLGDRAPANVVADLDESAALVHDETRRLGRITQSLLAGGDLVRTRIDGAVPLAAVVERARALVFAGVREGPRVEVGDGVDALSVVADPDRLMQVLVNLLQNAYDAVRDAPEGTVHIAARRDGPRVELVVEDDGSGIDPDVRSRLFEPFATTKPPGQGTGLGLYTSYMLVQAMGGDLDLEPREEGGTRAVVRLGAGSPSGLAPDSLLSQRPVR